MCAVVDCLIGDYEEPCFYSCTCMLLLQAPMLQSVAASHMPPNGLLWTAW
jgi:hypothetical protein